MSANPSTYSPLADYAMIGDCETVALVSKEGSIDWYCPDRFDTPAVFCRLLDAHRGGYLCIRPAGAHTAWRRYRDRTNVLVTTFGTDDGVVQITDFMPMRHEPLDAGTNGTRCRGIYRKVEALSGPVELELGFKPTFDYARTLDELEPTDAGAIARGGSSRLVLGCPGVALTPGPDGSLEGRFRLGPGEHRWVSLTISGTDENGQSPPAESTCEELLDRTCRFWETWAARCTYRGPYQSNVLRSALALKLMTYQPTGAIVAAPTTSLPEEIHGERNWDYRFTWLRDSSYTIFALMGIGYSDEARAFYGWLTRTALNDPTDRPQILYGIDGRRDVPELILPHLEGYQRSGPVRIGNGAATQHQLDVYGELLATAYLYLRATRKGGAAAPPGNERPTEAAWTHLCHLANRAAQEWQEPDSGIWEVRGGILQPFLYSRLICWLGLAMALRIAHEYQLDGPVATWSRTRDAIRQAILERGYDSRLGAFTQAFGTPVLDATALHVVLTGFMPPTDPRVQSTIRRIRTDLTREGLVYRYLGPDGLSGGEAPFTFCTFWLVNALALCGQLGDAYDVFERVIGYANDVGLLSEEFDPTTGEALGNMPQAFSHVGLIQAALNLARASREGIDERAETSADRYFAVRRAAAEVTPAVLRQNRDLVGAR